MNNKIIGICLVMLLIGITALMASGNINKKIDRDILNKNIQSIKINTCKSPLAQGCHLIISFVPVKNK